MVTFHPEDSVNAAKDSSYAGTAFSSQRRKVSVPLSPPELPPASLPPEPLPEPAEPPEPEGEQAAAVPSRPAAAKEERSVRRFSMAEFLPEQTGEAIIARRGYSGAGTAYPGHLPTHPVARRHVPGAGVRAAAQPAGEPTCSPGLWRSFVALRPMPERSSVVARHFWGRGWMGQAEGAGRARGQDRKSTRLNSSHVKISYAVFCLKKKKI